MSELHDFPYTEYESGGCCNNLGCMMSMCHRVGVSLAFNNGVLELLDRANHVISTVQIAYAETAAKDINDNPIIAYLISAGVRDKFLVLRNGNGNETILTIPYAEMAKYTEDGVELSSLLKSVEITGDQVKVTSADNNEILLTIPFAVKARTDVNDKALTTYAAGIAVSGNDIILTDGQGNIINTITCHYSERAAADENGNNIRESYASSLIAGSTTLKLISKAGDVLSEITVPYSTSALQDTNGNLFLHDYAETLTVDNDGKRLDLLAHDGTLLSAVTVPWSTLALDAQNAIERVEIVGNEIVFTTYGGVITRLTCPYSVKSLRDGNNNEISKTYIADVQQNNLTGEITFYDSEGTAIVAITPNSAHATYDSYDNLIADYIKTVVYDNQNDYFVFTTGTGETTSIVCGYSDKAYKDLRNNAIHDTYIAFVSNVQDNDNRWCLVFYNGEGSEKFRISGLKAEFATKDQFGNVIDLFYGHGLSISSYTLSLTDAHGNVLGSVTLPKDAVKVTFTRVGSDNNGYVDLELKNVDDIVLDSHRLHVYTDYDVTYGMVIKVYDGSTLICMASATEVDETQYGGINVSTNQNVQSIALTSEVQNLLYDVTYDSNTETIEMSVHTLTAPV